MLARAAKHRATLSLLDGLMAELDEVQLDPATVTREGLTTNGVEVLDLFTDYRSRVVDLVAPGQMLSQAIEAIDAGNAPQTHVILYSPSRLTATEKVFLRGLHDRHRISAVVAESPDVTTEWLRDLFGEGPAEPSQPANGEMRLSVAPDAEEEVRLKAGALETSGYAVANKLNDTQSKLESTRLLYVALTRAMDHLVLGCHHRPPKTGQPSHTQKVWDLLSTSVLAVVDPTPAGLVSTVPTQPLVTDVNSPAPSRRSQPWSRMSRVG